MFNKFYFRGGLIQFLMFKGSRRVGWKRLIEEKKGVKKRKRIEVGKIM